MPSVMSTGLSGLMAFQRAIDTTGHNISNANTTGYSRQSVEFGTRPSTPLGNGWVGNGVDVLTVKRSYDNFLSLNARAAGNSVSQLNVFSAQAERLNNMFGNADTGIAAQFQKFEGAMQGVASAPTSQAARQVLLGEGRATVTRLQNFDQQLRSLDAEVSSQIGSDVSEINTLAGGIARLNKEISAGLANTGQPPNDLLDQRENLLNQLAQKVTTTIVPQDSGVYNVFLGRGQALVLGSTTNKLQVQHDAFDASRPIIALKGEISTIDVTSSVSGGTLGGYLEFRSQMLDPVRSKLGTIATAFVDSVNAQHNKGMDLTGALGGDMFSIGGAVAIGAFDNAGSGTVSVARSSASTLQSTDYVLQKSAGGWSLTRTDTGAAVSMTGSGTVADPFVADGLAIQVGGAANVGDRFQIRPTRDAVAGLSMLINSPSAVAAAAPIRATAASANTGTGTTTLGEVLDPANGQLQQPVTLRFLTATTYSINGSGSFTYTSGQPIDINGWRVQISGAPAVGDQFSIGSNASGTGDNRNMLAVSDLLNSPLLENGTATLSQAIGGFVGDIGVRTHEAQINRDAQTAVLDETVKSRDNAQGVNLDEEAANLLRYQQAYQAISQVIRVASSMFDALLNATR